jgi:glycosyltransferase involved in cell wall biosynthesis
VRVLVLSSIFPNACQPVFGGFVRERVRHVAARCPSEVVATVPWFPLHAWIPGRASPPAYEEQFGLPVHHPRFFSIPGIPKSMDGPFYGLSLLPFLVRLRRRFAFDTIDAHFGYPDGFGAALLGLAFGCPVVVTLRGFESNLMRSALRRPQLRFALRRAAAVIVVSDSLRPMAEELGVPRERLRVIPNGIDANQFRPLPRAEARAGLGLPANRRILLSVGAFIERKGHERMLDVLALLIRRHPDLLYVAVGDVGGSVSRLGAIRRRVRELGLGDHVRLEVARPHDEIAAWMAAADLFCLATRDEGWCNALTEALACGLPAVCTRVGGNAEVMRHGEDGFLVGFFDAAEFGEAVARALEHNWDRTAIARRASARSWDVVADEVVQHFAVAFGGRAAPGSRP